MIYITQLIYVNEGQEKTLDEFESVAIPAILRYKGKLLFRIRPSESNFIESHIENPYEIHLIEFETQKDFDNFKQDEERKRFLHLKDQAIKTSILLQGTRL